MQNTTRPTVVALPSIHDDLLLHVSGGCHKGGGQQACAPAPAAPAPVIQVMQMQAPQVLPQPAPPALPPEPSGPEVSTHVSIGQAQG
jgi:hypothetical protein